MADGGDTTPTTLEQSGDGDLASGFAASGGPDLGTDAVPFSIPYNEPGQPALDEDTENTAVKTLEAITNDENQNLYEMHTDCSEDCKTCMFDGVIYHAVQDSELGFQIKEWLEENVTRLYQKTQYSPRLKLLQELHNSPYMKGVDKAGNVSKTIILLITKNSLKDALVEEGNFALWAQAASKKFEIIPLLVGFDDEEAPKVFSLLNAHYVRYKPETKYFRYTMQQRLFKFLHERVQRDTVRQKCEAQRRQPDNIQITPPDLQQKPRVAAGVDKHHNKAKSSLEAVSRRSGIDSAVSSGSSQCATDSGPKAYIKQPRSDSPLENTSQQRQGRQRDVHDQGLGRKTDLETEERRQSAQQSSNSIGVPDAANHSNNASPGSFPSPAAQSESPSTLHQTAQKSSESLLSETDSGLPTDVENDSKGTEDAGLHNKRELQNSTATPDASAEVSSPNKAEIRPDLGRTSPETQIRNEAELRRDVEEAESVSEEEKKGPDLIAARKFDSASTNAQTSSFVENQLGRKTELETEERRQSAQQSSNTVGVLDAANPSNNASPGSCPSPAEPAAQSESPSTLLAYGDGRPAAANNREEGAVATDSKGTEDAGLHNKSELQISTATPECSAKISSLHKAEIRPDLGRTSPETQMRSKAEFRRDVKEAESVSEEGKRGPDSNAARKFDTASTNAQTSSFIENQQQSEADDKKLHVNAQKMKTEEQKSPLDNLQHGTSDSTAIPTTACKPTRAGAGPGETKEDTGEDIAAEVKCKPGAGKRQQVRNVGTSSHAAPVKQKPSDLSEEKTKRKDNHSKQQGDIHTDCDAYYDEPEKQKPVCENAEVLQKTTDREDKGTRLSKGVIPDTQSREETCPKTCPKTLASGSFTDDAEAYSVSKTPTQTDSHLSSPVAESVMSSKSLEAGLQETSENSSGFAGDSGFVSDLNSQRTGSSIFSEETMDSKVGTGDTTSTHSNPFGLNSQETPHSTPLSSLTHEKQLELCAPERQNEVEAAACTESDLAKAPSNNPVWKAAGPVLKGPVQETHQDEKGKRDVEFSVNESKDFGFLPKTIPFIDDIPPSPTGSGYHTEEEAIKKPTETPKPPPTSTGSDRHTEEEDIKKPTETPKPTDQAEAAPPQKDSDLSIRPAVSQSLGELYTGNFKLGTAGHFIIGPTTVNNITVMASDAPRTAAAAAATIPKLASQFAPPDTPSAPALGNDERKEEVEMTRRKLPRRDSTDAEEEVRPESDMIPDNGDNISQVSRNKSKISRFLCCGGSRKKSKKPKKGKSV